MTPEEQMRAKVRNAFVLRSDDVEHVRLYAGWLGNPCIETLWGRRQRFDCNSRCEVLTMLKSI